MNQLVAVDQEVAEYFLSVSYPSRIITVQSDLVLVCCLVLICSGWAPPQNLKNELETERNGRDRMQAHATTAKRGTTK